MSWINDQHAAAARDLKPLERSLAQLGALHRSTAVSNPARFVQELYAAMTRRVVTECPHTRGVAPPPLLCNVSAGWLVCLGCLAKPEIATALDALSHGDDGHCDLCEEATETFVAATVALGPAQVAWNMCCSCRDRWQI